MGGGEEVVFAAAKQSRRPRTRGRGPSLVTFAGLVLAATGLATIALVLLTGTTLAQSAPHFESADAPKKLGSLKTVTPPTPPNLSDFVLDQSAAVALGKAFFWDQQMGGDGQTACATCHSQAGADVRTKNTISPGVLAGTTNFFGKGPNYQLSLADYPLHHLIDADDNQSVTLGDTEDVTGSQAVFFRPFTLPGIPAPLTKG